MRKPINTAKQHLDDPLAFLGDAMVMGPSAAIEHQEALGQRSFVGSDTMPTEGDGKEVLESFGFKFLGPVEGDPIFQFVEMPKGWKKVPTDHSMWSYIHDEQDRKRVAVFYKAAFYDRSAHYSLERRFAVRKDYAERTTSVAEVLDSGKVIYSTEPLKHLAGQEREIILKNYQLDDQAVKAATDWLSAQYPDWQNVAAYWR